MKMLRTYKIFLVSLFWGASAAPVWAQVSYSYRGLNEDLSYPTWELPTPACYGEQNTETHYNIVMRDCDCGCTSGVATNGSSTRSSTRENGVEIFYPPFADKIVLYI